LLKYTGIRRKVEQNLPSRHESVNSDHILLLDLDGTIVTSTFRAFEAKAEVLREVSQLAPTNGLSVRHHIRDYFLFADSLPDTVREEARSKISEIITKYELESVSRSTLKPGAADVLSYFRERMPVCVVSNSGREAVDETLRRFGLEASFDLVLSRDDVPDLKPSPAGILLALNKFKRKPEAAAMVGDTPMDVIAASAANVTSVAIADGVASINDLTKEWPDFLTRDLIETKALLTRLWRLS
jgi:HAD superfamily hydrolase (TIGR01549 family)